MAVLLRDYQEEMVSGARQALVKHRRVLIQSPTGSGKTILATFMMSQTVARGAAAWFICHRAELVDGTSKTLRKFGIAHAIIASGYPQNLLPLAQVCSIDTLKSRLAHLKAPRLAIIDEAHHSGAAGWGLVIDWLHKAGTLIIGLSATPQRLDGRGLDAHFDFMVPGPSVAWLMENGHLSQYEGYIPGGGMDMGGVGKRAGEFISSDIERKTNKPKLVGDCIGHWRKHAQGMRTVGFGYSLEFSRYMVEQFNLAGIPSAHLDGETPKEERRRVIDSYASGEILVLWNRFLFGEGFDLAAIAQRDVTIDCVIDNAPTLSVSLAMQRWGRALRPQPGKVAILLDHAGNMRRHGFPDDEREWTLEGRDRAAGKKPDGPPPPVDCPQCFRQWRRPLPVRCGCGHLFEDPKGFKPMAVSDEELRLAGEQVKRQVRQDRAREQAEAKTLDELVNLGRKRGHRNPVGWARKVWGGRRHGHSYAVEMA